MKTKSSVDFIKLKMEPKIFQVAVISLDAPRPLRLENVTEIKRSAIRN